ncbi:MAG TPA: N-acetylmuramoyl-L-alanine amidase, partial [Gemmatimonadales bacterium]|nr:N-acetylmuramoyl-L-alanine amidase [Gemmatimonadales bacterium]
LGIANLGDFQKESPTKDALKAQADLIKWLADIHGFKTDGKVKVKSQGGTGNRYDNGEKAKIDAISGHRDVTQTDCPGDKLYGELKKLRKLVN